MKGNDWRRGWSWRGERAGEPSCQSTETEEMMASVLVAGEGHSRGDRE